jgi:long-chain acyl-CoA synthetase
VRKYLRDNYPKLSLPESNKKVILLPQVHDLIQQQIDKYNPLFNHTEQIKKFSLLADEWTIDTGELTPSLKMKRKVIAQKYAAQIEEMYVD